MAGRNRHTPIANLRSGGSTTKFLNENGSYTTPAGSGANQQPVVTNSAGTFTASGTSTIVTMTAPDAGANLIAIVCSASRGCNSITQTNVTWTQRYTASGNSRFIEVWTGVAAAAAGTTATFAFTGANSQQCFTCELPNETDFTSATALSTTTSAGATELLCYIDTVTINDIILIVSSRNNPSTSFFTCSHEYNPVGATGGAGNYGVLKANSVRIFMSNTSSTSVSGFIAIIKIS